ncbi:nitrite reductase [Bacillus sp. HMF5848]|uniref:nitrite reductase n=1 Tax=Bacillus sp. HMF5848 TaxID=2495421 RepID=UPI000F781324|nr:nitrite reductase [Bacillus sp. HMF5848]RSK26679.1 nitrite reductase [Bacillus sp. HMF5848]
MTTESKYTKLAINGGIGFGAMLTGKQLKTVIDLLGEDTAFELTTFQQLYVDVRVNEVDEIKRKLEQVGFSCYPVGLYVKSLRTCNFCQGAEEEGMPIAIELNRRIAGKPVPFPLKPAYTGCPNACGEPLVNDIGVIKRGEKYDLYIGGKAKGRDAKVGKLYKEQLEPDELYREVEQLIASYAENGKKREHFSKYISRTGII